MASFSNKKGLRFIITLGTGKFGSGDDNQITIEGFRAVAAIDKAGGMMMGTLQAQIYGVSQSDMNSITTLQWKTGFLIVNTVQVYAIDGSQETLVFQGNIVNAWGNYQNLPNVFLQIQAQSAYFNQLSPVVPRSYQGSADVATIMGNIAKSMSLTFENNGVNIPMQNVYLANTDLAQAKQLANDAPCDLYVDDTILAITPKNGPRTKPIPLVSPDSELCGYPTFDGVGVNFQMLFDPAVTFGGLIDLQTSIKQAAGQWIVTSVSYLLESEKIGGAWFAKVRGNANGLAISK